MHSMAIALLFSVTMGTAPISDAVQGEFATAVRIALVISTVLCVIGTAPALARGRLHKAAVEARGGVACVAAGDRP
jgi:hypothetical protein